jgi:hypothetical protein
MEIVDMAWQLLTAVLGVVMGAWVVRRMMFSKESIMEMADSVFEYLLSTKEGQQKLYTAAAYIGKGIRDGVGIKTGGGKHKIEDIFIEIGTHLAEKALGVGKEAENPQDQRKMPWES